MFPNFSPSVNWCVFCPVSVSHGTGSVYQERLDGTVCFIRCFIWFLVLTKLLWQNMIVGLNPLGESHIDPCVWNHNTNTPCFWMWCNQQLLIHSLKCSLVFSPRIQTDSTSQVLLLLMWRASRRTLTRCWTTSFFSHPYPTEETINPTFII